VPSFTGAGWSAMPSTTQRRGTAEPLDSSHARC
jgi:hypothetical protein